MRISLRALVIDASGAIFTEYALVAVLIAVVAVAAVTYLGISVFGLYDRLPMSVFE